MRQLKGIESMCLRLESSAAPMHASTLTIYDRSTAVDGRVAFGDILRHFRERLHRAGVFRRRVVGLPLKLARPYWIDERDFDVEFHLRHIALPRPGDWRQLMNQVARLHAMPLDRTRPLWECYLIDELDAIPDVAPGAFALFIKTHYAALGGVLGTQLLAALHELAPDGRASAPKEVQYYDRVPSLAQLAVASAFDALKSPAAIAAQFARRAAPLIGLGRNEGDRRASAVERAEDDESWSIPRTRFNRRISPHRAIEAVRFDRAEIASMRERVGGASLLDVALAIIAGGLREYLDGLLELPESSLIAEIPVSDRPLSGDPAGPALTQSGLVRLHTDIDDPVERLRRIADDAHQVRGGDRQWLRQLAFDALEWAPEIALGQAARVGRRLRHLKRRGPIANTTVSVVRGPDAPLYLAGARLVAWYGLPPLQQRSGIAHVVGTVDGSVTIGVAACRALLPDPARYAEALARAGSHLAHALGDAPANVVNLRGRRRAA